MISVEEPKVHYQTSKENYTIEGAESHLTYYRENIQRTIRFYYKMFNLTFKCYGRIPNQMLFNSTKQILTDAQPNFNRHTIYKDYRIESYSTKYMK